jgi:hypothetical protein
MASTNSHSLIFRVHLKNAEPTSSVTPYVHIIGKITSMPPAHVVHEPT